MAKDRAPKTEADSPLKKLKAEHAAGDIKAARARARLLAADPAASEADRAFAARYLEDSDVDPRALQVASIAGALAILVVVVFILLR